MNKKVLFLDGKIISSSDIDIESLTPGVLTGRGVFETMRACEGRILCLEQHLTRLTRGLKKLSIQAPYSKKEIKQNMIFLLQLNKTRNARIRLMVWRKNRKEHMAVIVLPYNPFPTLRYTRGFKALVSHIKRDESSEYAYVKSLDYRIFLQAYCKAKKKKYDEGIFLNRNEHLVEGSRSNIFFFRKDKLCTPALICGCLCGITRQIVIKMARAMGIKVAFVKATLRELLEADEAFLTNSLMGIMPLTCVENQVIGEGRGGPKTNLLSQKYHRLIHEDNLLVPI